MGKRADQRARRGAAGSGHRDSARGWLAHSSTDHDIAPRPWLPPTLDERGFKQSDARALRYIVVEEFVEDHVGLSISPWPDADEHGRLRFRIEGLERVGVHRDELQRYVEDAAGRGNDRLRIGDAFAAEVSGSLPDVLTPPLSRWLKNPIDITADARRVAKLAFYGATADVLDTEQATRWRLDQLAEREG